MVAGKVIACDNDQMASQTITRPVARQRQIASRTRAGLPTAVSMIVTALILLPLLMVGGAWMLVMAAAQGHDITKTDAIVVLGAAQFDGTPSPVLKARLTHALELWQAGVAPAIITVGGRQPSDRYTEAGVGRQWLVEHGVPVTAVFAVQDGNDTVSSLTDAAQLSATQGWSSITLVSDPAHMARSEAIADRLGFETHLNPTRSGDGSELTNSYVARETAGYLAFEVLEQWGMSRPIDGDSAAASAGPGSAPSPGSAKAR